MDALKALQSLGMGDKATGPDGAKLLQQAQQIWGMLDDMADKDPQAYAKFIDKQKKEYAEANAPPEPYMCVKTHYQTPGQTTLYVNLVAWPRVPKPRSKEDNIPLYAAPLDNIKDKKTGETYSIATVACNPEILEEYGYDAKNSAERKDFILLNLEYVQHLSGIPVSRSFTIQPRSSNFKGDLEKDQKFFTDSLKKAMKKDKNSSEKQEEPMPDSDIPDSMLHKLANISVSSESSNQSNETSQKAFVSTPPISVTPVKDNSKAAKKNLIEELHSDVVKLTQPTYKLEKSASGDGLVLQVELPGVKKVSDCLLDISEDDVTLVVEGQYELTVKLPQCIDDSEAQAQFSKKQSVLTLQMPLLSSS